MEPTTEPTTTTTSEPADGSTTAAPLSDAVGELNALRLENELLRDQARQDRMRMLDPGSVAYALLECARHVADPARVAKYRAAATYVCDRLAAEILSAEEGR